MHTGIHKNEVSRRTLLRIIGCSSFFITIGIAVVSFIRFLFPRVLFEKPSTFMIGHARDFISDATELKVYEDWKTECGVWIIREKGYLYALNAKCTHLGCIPNWFPDEGVFKCPCHGSQFHSNGINFAGPAPRPLDRLGIYINDKGMIMVDRSKVYSYKDFNKKGAYLKIG